jgi:hypothetical protein
MPSPQFSANRAARRDTTCSPIRHFRPMLYLPKALKIRFNRVRSDVKSGSQHARCSPQSARINVLEIRFVNTLSLSRSDSRIGRYAEQPWRMHTAQRDGVCALSNRSLTRGDTVYRPCRMRNRVPENYDRMIVVSVVSRDHRRHFFDNGESTKLQYKRFKQPKIDKATISLSVE